MPGHCSGQVVKSLNGLFDNVTLAAVRPWSARADGTTLNHFPPATVEGQGWLVDWQRGHDRRR